MAEHQYVSIQVNRMGTAYTMGRWHVARVSLNTYNDCVVCKLHTIWGVWIIMLQSSFYCIHSQRVQEALKEHTLRPNDFNVVMIKQSQSMDSDSSGSLTKLDQFPWVARVNREGGQISSYYPRKYSSAWRTNSLIFTTAQYHQFMCISCWTAQQIIYKKI